MRSQGFTDARALLPAAGARLLLVRLDNIGDVVLLSPALRAIRAALPDADLALLASPAGAQGAALLPEVDRVIEHRASWQQLTPGAVPPEDELALVERLRAEAFDAAIIFTSFSQSPIAPAYACYLAGIPIRAAYAPDAFTGEVITHPVPIEALQDHQALEDHQADRAVHLVRALGFEAPDTSLSVHIPDDAHASADRLLRAAGIEDGAPFVALVPGASAPARRYARDRFALVARGLAAQGAGARRLPVLVLGSDRETALAGELEAEAGAFEVISFAGRTSLLVMAAVIARASLVIANNSLALHLADALGVPVVSTYAGTDPAGYWEPRRVPHRLLSRPVPCSPCFRVECDRGHECLDIEPREVIAAAESLLAPIEVRASEGKPA